jgi:hypothetical protein
VRDYVREMDLSDIIISGGCKDSPDVWAVEEGLRRGIVCLEFPVSEEGLPPWTNRAARIREWAKRAFERNTLIAAESDRLVAFWDGKSHGTYDTITRARARGIPVAIF